LEGSRLEGSRKKKKKKKKRKEEEEKDKRASGGGERRISSFPPHLQSPLASPPSGEVAFALRASRSVFFFFFPLLPACGKLTN